LPGIDVVQIRIIHFQNTPSMNPTQSAQPGIQYCSTREETPWFTHRFTAVATPQHRSQRLKFRAGD
jgi:hypothetical protein